MVRPVRSLKPRCLHSDNLSVGSIKGLVSDYNHGIALPIFRVPGVSMIATTTRGSFGGVVVLTMHSPGSRHDATTPPMILAPSMDTSRSSVSIHSARGGRTRRGPR